jgi:hypothetical protein
MTEAGDYARIALAVVGSILCFRRAPGAPRPREQGATGKSVANTLELCEGGMAFGKLCGKTVWVLDGIEVTLRDGEILCLLGRPGS